MYRVDTKGMIEGKVVFQLAHTSMFAKLAMAAATEGAILEMEWLNPDQLEKLQVVITLTRE